MRSFNYVYHPEKLIAGKPQIHGKNYKQTFVLDVDKMEYTVTIMIEKKKLFVAFRCNFNLYEGWIELHTNEEHVFKLFCSLNDILNRYIRTQGNILQLGDFVVESIELSPSLNIKLHAIALQQRNKLYEDFMWTYIFNNAVEFNTEYNGNNLVFKDLINLRTKKPLQFSHI